MHFLTTTRLPASPGKFILAFTIFGHIILGTLTLGSLALAQENLEPAIDDERQAKLAERFLTILERNPRRGTALDRAYGYFVESDTIESLISRYKDRLKKVPDDGAAWLVLGLIHAKRGDDTQAIKAFQKAVKCRPEDAMAAFYLGQTLAITGRNEEAAQAYEDAIARKPRQTDLLTVYQSLGRLYQRSQQPAQALKVWNRLERSFPDDERVKEQIALTLAEEGEHSEALRRFEQLLQADTSDPGKRVQYQIEAANLKVKLGQNDAAIRDFEQLLVRLKRGTWLHRQARERIESIFRRSNDLAALVNYYEEWTAKHADDVDAMALLARVLSQMGRSKESQEWFTKAIAKAPTNIPLRLQYIEELEAKEKYRNAAEEYQRINKIAPNNPDYIRQWGITVLKDASKTPQEREQRATDIWMTFVDGRKNDPVVATQFADLFRQAELTQQAISLSRRAVQLAPERPQYREYLGQLYHELKRPVKALEVWKSIASGNRKSAESLNRLAKVLARFGYSKEAIEASEEACELDATIYSRNLFYVDLLIEAGRSEDALGKLDHLVDLAETDEEKQGVLDRRIELLKNLGTLQLEINRLQQATNKKSETSAEHWLRLAQYLVANDQNQEALDAIGQAIQLSPDLLSAWRFKAELLEKAGQIKDASDANRKLATIDRRFKSQYLKNIAQLESTLGRVDLALEAGRNLIAAAPGNSENYHFYADLCFRFGQTDEGLNAMRRAMRSNPNEPEHILRLASALATRFKTADAIELYWQALSKTDELQAQLGIVGRLTELHLQTGAFEKLIDRLERLRTRSNRDRETTFLIAEAHLDAQNYTLAMKELARLLAENERDTLLLRQLSVIGERAGEMDAALNYQRQLFEIAPDPSNRNRLAQLLLKAGDVENAEKLWTQLVFAQTDVVQVYQSIDKLLAYQRYKSAETILKELQRRLPDNWEVLHRFAMLYGLQSNWNKAKPYCERILSLQVSENEQSSKGRIAAEKNSSNNSPNSQQGVIPNDQKKGLIGRTYAVYLIRRITGLERTRSPASLMRSIWTPDDFGQAKMAAIAWMYRMAESEKSDFAERFLTGAIDKYDARQLWDQWYANAMLNQAYTERTHAIAEQLVKTDTTEAHWLYFATLASGPIGNQVAELSNERIEQAVASYKRVQQTHPEWIEPYFLNSFIVKLDRAGKKEIGNTLYTEAIRHATSVEELTTFLSIAGTRGDTDSILLLIDRIFESTSSGQSGPSSIQYLGTYITSAVPKWEIQQRYGDVIKVLQRYLALSQLPRNRLLKNAAGNDPFAPRKYYLQYQHGRRPAKALTYPQPNHYYDANAIAILLNAHDLYRRNNKLDVLYEEIQLWDKGNDVDHRTVILTKLATSYLSAWDQNRQKASEILAEVIQLDPSNIPLRFALAGLQKEMGDHSKAIATIDAVDVNESRLLVIREQHVLEWALTAGATERARQAAKRLFGMRLTPSYQLTLAKRMERLKMDELAETILQRARRRSGNDLTNLVKIMETYQAKSQNEVAVEVAHQILRRTSTSSGVRMTVANSSTNAAQIKATNAAIALLKSSGKLDELIKRAEVDLARSPKSIKIMRTLAEYYSLTGNKTRSNEFFNRILAINPNDPELRYQVAGFVYETDKAEGLEMLTNAISQDLMLFTNNHQDVRKKYRDQDKLGELADVLIQADLGQVKGNPWEVQNLISELTKEQTNRDKGIELFIAYWKAFPQYHQYLLQSVHSPEVLTDPRVYPLFEKSFLGSQIVTTPIQWTLSSTIIEWKADSEVQLIFHLFLDSAEKRGDLPKVIEKLQVSLRTNKSWKDGQVLLIMAYIRNGDWRNAEPMIRDLANDKAIPISAYAALGIGVEIEKHPDLRQQAVKLYERVVNGPKYQLKDTYKRSPAERLVFHYKKDKRLGEARSILLRYANPTDNGYYQPAESARFRLGRRLSIGQELLEIGFALDAVLLFQKVLDSRDDLKLSLNPAQYRSQAKEGIANAWDKLEISALQEYVEETAHRPDGNEKERLEIPLFTYVDGNSLSNSEVISPILQTILECANARSEAYQTLGNLIDERAGKDARFSLRVTQACLGWEIQDERPTTESIMNRVKPLLDYLEALPLKKPNGKSATPAQKQIQAKQRLSLASLGEACIDLGHKEPKSNGLIEIGERLMQIAFKAAVQCEDIQSQMVLKFRLGQIAHKSGKPDEAERHWQQLLDLILNTPVTVWNTQLSSFNAATGSRTATNAYSSYPMYWPTLSAQSPTMSANSNGATEKRVTPISMTQFQLTMELATIATKHDLADFSFRCIQESFKKGWPANSATGQSDFPGYVRTLGSDGAAIYSREAPSHSVNAIATSLESLVKLWKQHEYPSKKIYACLADIILPQTQPRVINVAGLTVGTPENPVRGLTPTTSPICEFMVGEALESGQRKKLMSRIELRQQSPKSEADVRFLRALVAIKANDSERLESELRWFQQKLRDGLDQKISNTAAGVAIAACDSELQADAVELLRLSITRSLYSDLSDADDAKISELLVAQLVKSLALETEQSFEALFNIFGSIIVDSVAKQDGSAMATPKFIGFGEFPAQNSYLPKEAYYSLRALFRLLESDQKRDALQSYFQKRRDAPNEKVRASFRTAVLSLRWWSQQEETHANVVEQLQAWAESQPENVEVQILLIRALFTKSRFAECLKWFDRLPDSAFETARDDHRNELLRFMHHGKPNEKVTAAIEQLSGQSGIAWTALQIAILNEQFRKRNVTDWSAYDPFGLPEPEIIQAAHQSGNINQLAELLAPLGKNGETEKIPMYWALRAMLAIKLKQFPAARHALEQYTSLLETTPPYRVNPEAKSLVSMAMAYEETKPAGVRIRDLVATMEYRSVILKPDSAEALSKNTLAVTSNGSIQLKGAKAETDEFYVHLRLPNEPVVGLRLEVINPGDEVRYSRIDTIEVTETTASGQSVRTIKFAAAYSAMQDRGNASAMIDNDPRTYWRVGKSFGGNHSVILKFDKPVSNKHLKITIKQNYGRSYILRSFRLHAVLDRKPLPDEPLDIFPQWNCLGHWERTNGSRYFFLQHLGVYRGFIAGLPSTSGFDPWNIGRERIHATIPANSTPQLKFLYLANDKNGFPTTPFILNASPFLMTHEITPGSESDRFIRID